MTLPMSPKNTTFALKWFVSFLIPALVYWLLPIDGKTLTHEMALFLAITTWAVCMWAMDTMNRCV